MPFVRVADGARADTYEEMTMATERAPRAPEPSPLAVIEGGGRLGAPATMDDAAVGKAIDRLEELYEFRDRDEVRAFLAANPDLLPLVAETAAKIPEYLPPDGRLVLEVFRSYEDEEDVELFAWIPTLRGHEYARPRINQLTRDWLIYAGRFAAGRFNVLPAFR